MKILLAGLWSRRGINLAALLVIWLAVTAAVLGPALAGVPGVERMEVVLHGRSADVSRVLELLRRHGARLDVEARTKVGQHSAVRGRVARTRATPPG